MAGDKETSRRNCPEQLKVAHNAKDDHNERRLHVYSHTRIFIANPDWHDNHWRLPARISPCQFLCGLKVNFCNVHFLWLIHCWLHMIPPGSLELYEDRRVPNIFGNNNYNRPSSK